MRPATLDIDSLVVGQPGAQTMRMPLPDAPTSRAALREGLRHAIELGVLTPGTRLRRGHDIARAVGLSRSTVSAAVFDLVHDGLLDRCTGGGTVIRPRDQHLEVRIVARADALAGPLVEEVDILPHDDDGRTRRFTQHLWGRRVATVKVDCDPHWWTPPPAPLLANRLGPVNGVHSVDLRIREELDDTGAPCTRVSVLYDGGHAQCRVEMLLASGLYVVQTQ